MSVEASLFASSSWCSSLATEAPVSVELHSVLLHTATVVKRQPLCIWPGPTVLWYPTHSQSSSSCWMLKWVTWNMPLCSSKQAWHHSRKDTDAPDATLCNLAMWSTQAWTECDPAVACKLLLKVFDSKIANDSVLLCNHQNIFLTVRCQEFDLKWLARTWKTAYSRVVPKGCDDLFILLLLKCNLLLSSFHVIGGLLSKSCYSAHNRHLVDVVIIWNFKVTWIKFFRYVWIMSGALILCLNH